MRKAAKEKTEDFLKRHGVSFPIIKEDGSAAAYFEVTGVPAVRLTYKGKLLWQGYIPSNLPVSRYMIEGIVKAQQSL